MYRLFYKWLSIYGMVIFMVGCYNQISDPIMVEHGSSRQKFVEVQIWWSAPSEGSPVEFYKLEGSVGGKPFRVLTEPTGNSSRVLVAVGVIHVFRVAGVDSLGRQGVYSESSDPLLVDPENQLVPMISLE